MDIGHGSCFIAAEDRGDGLQFPLGELQNNLQIRKIKVNIDIEEFPPPTLLVLDSEDIKDIK